MLIEILKAVLFGIVEGITEWLPISSTGHMILVDQFVHLNVSADFYKMFEVVIQLGAIMAVVVLFWNKLWPFHMKNEKPAWKDGALSMWLKIIVAVIPAAIIGVLFDDKIDELFYHPVPVAIALIVVGVLFIVVETIMKGKKPSIRNIGQITYKAAVIIGFISGSCSSISGNISFRCNNHWCITYRCFQGNSSRIYFFPRCTCNVRCQSS